MKKSDELPPDPDFGDRLQFDHVQCEFYLDGKQIDILKLKEKREKVQKELDKKYGKTYES